MKRIRKKRFYALLFLAMMLVLFYNNTWIGRLIYPIQYREDIEAAAAANQVDPLLIAAIIRVESNYRTSSESHKGALGIMQLMPDTANWLIERDSSLASLRNRDLKDPKVNIQLGARYLNYLNDRFGGNRTAISAAYNAGHGKVARWLEDKTWDGTLEQADRIPINETRKYVKSVEYYYSKYVQVYR
ncbi:lytic transglycosylase domain-containing protein [Gorillibacterium timonense]|uniref:lytic transglycosylase domain-containing protein n=1 Tax=Gorillibacterium timonense TaxID=1689269 RepID=UPI00071E6104|nr:lytic transglycosylase domain-containing protein [Gorillibacterium timonense]